MKVFAFLFLSFATVIASPVLAVVMVAAPSPNGIALVVASPWGIPIADIISASDFTEVYPGRAPLGAFVLLSPTQSLGQLYENGAWFALNGEKILESC